MIIRFRSIELWVYPRGFSLDRRCTFFLQKERPRGKSGGRGFKSRFWHLNDFQFIERALNVFEKNILNRNIF